MITFQWSAIYNKIFLKYLLKSEVFVVVVLCVWNACAQSASSFLYSTMDGVSHRPSWEELQNFPIIGFGSCSVLRASHRSVYTVIQESSLLDEQQVTALVQHFHIILLKSRN